MESKFPLGCLKAMETVVTKMCENPDFADFVWASVQRYCNADWGEMVAADHRRNNAALVNGDARIFATYTNEWHSDWTIWIITEWDHSATTVLFPSDY